MTNPVKLLISKQSPLFYFTLIVSGLIHLILIIGFQLSAPKKQTKIIPTLDVILVNSKTLSPPIESEVLSQVNSNKGGNTSEEKQIQSALALSAGANHHPDLQKLQTEASKKQALSIKKQKQVKALEKQAQSLMSKIKSDYELNTSKTTTQQDTSENTESTNGRPTLNFSDLIESSAEIAKMEAQISKQQQEYQKRPKRKAIGARSQEYQFAAYMEAWRLKVERIGNLNYPEAAKEKMLYGRLQMTVSIRSDGSLEKIEVRRSSGHPILDNAAKKIVEMGAPYAAFSENMRNEADVIDITRTWTFTKDDSLKANSAE